MNRRFRKAKRIDQDGASIWTRDAMEAIEKNTEVRVMIVKEFFDEREVKD